MCGVKRVPGLEVVLELKGEFGGCPCPGPGGWRVRTVAGGGGTPWKGRQEGVLDQVEVVVFVQGWEVQRRGDQGREGRSEGGGRGDTCLLFPGKLN